MHIITLWINIFKHCERDQKLIIFPNIDTFPSALQLMIPWTIRLKELFFKLTHSTQRHPRASIIHRKRILQQRGRDYSQISDNTLPKTKRVSIRESLSLLFNTFQRPMKSMTISSRAISTSPRPPSHARYHYRLTILGKDFNSWFHLVATRALDYGPYKEAITVKR